ncbi:MAG: polysaccharide biosynthesis/export family protein [Lentisphaerae bacterium]|nr:polysaccharide biosynthesis/export family protein [Lentisphaerota bacterium]
MAGSNTILHSLRFRLLRSSLWCIVLGLMVVVVAGCATEPGHRRREVDMERVTFSFDDSEEFDLFNQYEIQPGDLLDVLYQIKTWEEKKSFNLTVDNQISVKFPKVPSLNETQRIRPDGMVTLPYLGDLYVADMTISELTAVLKKRYAKILKEPELYVVVREFRSAIKELKADLHTAPRGLSRLVTVRPDGYCTFSMIGDVYVAGKTLPDVNEILNSKYGTGAFHFCGDLDCRCSSIY